MKEEITFETTAYHYPDEGGVIDVNIQVKVNVLNNQIFYHVIMMTFEKHSFTCGILLLKSNGLYKEYNYTFRHGKKDYYLNINI